MSDIHCICCKQLSDDNRKNVFDEKLLITSQEKDTHEEFDGYMILRDAIELIIGYTILKTDNAILCKTCFHKVESYMKFRSQLIASFGRLNAGIQSDTQISELVSSSLENADVTNSLISKISNTGSDVSEKIMNVNENEVSYISNYSNLSSSEVETDSSTNLLLNFHNVDNASDYSSDIDDNLNVTSRSKIQKSDIESDVNVCSGEDDEVLELSVEYKHNETINMSSTESEEDYDYGPTFKKIKLSNRISSPLILSHN